MMEDRRIVVVGGAGGIGRAVVAGLAADGARVAAIDVSPDALATIAVPDGAPLVTIAADASDTDAITAAMDRARDELGGIDGLVNTVGLFQPMDFASSHPTDWDLALQVNLVGVMKASWAALPALMESGSGAIVHFASTAGEYGSIRPAAAYAAAKGGVIAFTKSLAREVAEAGVRVNCISPGPVQTSMFAAGDPASNGASRTLLGRMGTPDDLVPAVRYLVSPHSSYVTGEVLRVNGGSLI